MKIRSLAVNQFKKFTDPVSVNGFADGLNVVVGPNEMGKSTLLDALRAALFEKYSSKARPITSLQNDRNQAAPVVELEFEIDDGRYRVRKRFVKKPYAQLLCPDGRKLEGDAAEDALRKLLGFDQPGKTGANRETLGMWNVLWVEQGQSFGALDLPDSARSSLHSALEAEVGTVLGGKRGRALPDGIDKQLSMLQTSTGRPRGEYKEQIDETKSLEADLEDLRARCKELTQTLDDLESAQETLERLSTGDPDLTDKQELDNAREIYNQLTKLESQIQAATTEVELRQRDVKAAQQSLVSRKQLLERISAAEEAVESAKDKLELVCEQEQQVQARLSTLRKAVRQAEKGNTEADTAVSRERQVLGAVQRAARIRELKDRHQKAADAEERQRAAQQAAAAILVTNNNIKEIRHAAKNLEKARTSLSAAATRVTFDINAEKFSRIEIDEVALSDDRTTVQIVEATNISIPDYGQITVEPAIQDRDKLLRQNGEARDLLRVALEKCSVSSLDEAEEKLLNRQKYLQETELARQEAELHAPASEDHDAGATALADYIAGMQSILSRELAELGIQKLPGASEANKAYREAEDRAREAREEVATLRAALEGPESEHRRIQNELGANESRYEDGQGRLRVLKEELAEAEENYSEKDLEVAVVDAEKALADKSDRVSSLESQRSEETLPQLEARIARLDKAIQDRREKHARLKERIAGLRSRIEVLEGAGIDEAIEKTLRGLELAQEKLNRYGREVKVLSLLLSTLRSAESEAKERYLSPVLKRVRPYLQILFPGADIVVDENLHILGVVREDGHEESFGHLSMGTQEQIAVLVRLAFAEMLVEQGHPATVVLDDALVFSDDRRMGRMFDILNLVAQRVQIVVLTCREQLFEGIGGEHLSLVAGNAEQLVSA